MAQAEIAEGAMGRERLRLRRRWLPRWSRLDGYFFAEIHYPFFIAMLLYNGMFFIQTLGEISDLSGGMFAIPVRLATIFFISRLPDILIITTPLAFTLAALTAFGRMSGDSEIIAPQTLGLSFWRMNRAALVYGFILTVLLSALANFAGPAMTRHWQQAYYTFVDEEAAPNLDQGVINSLGKDSILYVESVDRGRLANVLFISQGQQQEEVLLARRASIYTNRSLEVFDALHLKLSLDPKTERAVELFQSRNSEQAMPMPQRIAKRRLIGGEREAMSSPALYAHLRAGKGDVDYWLELYQRLFGPLILLVLPLFAAPLAAKHSRFRRGSGFVWSIILIGGYFLVSKLTRDAASQGNLDPLKALTYPLAAFLILGVLLQFGKNLWWRQWFSRYLDQTGLLFSRLGAALAALVRSLSGKRKPESARKRHANGRPAQTFMFPSKLDLYVTKSFFKIYAMVQLSLLVLLTLVEYSQLSKFIHRYQADSETVLRYLLFKMPEMIMLSMFSCMLIAALILFSLMSKYQEVTAVRAGGGSLRRLSFPLLLCGALASAGSYYMENSFLPKANRVAASLSNRIKNHKDVLFSDDVWLKRSNNEILNYRYFDADNVRLAGVRHYRFNPEGPEYLSWTDMPSLVYEGGRWLVERDSKVWRFYSEEDDIVAKPEALPAGSSFPLTLQMDDLSQKKRRASEFSVQELRAYLQYLNDLGYSESHYQTELYAKFAKPLIPFVVMLLAVPLGFHFGRRGAFYGVGAGLVAGLVFMGLFEMLKSLGSSGVLHPLAAGWTAVVVFGFISVYRFINMES